MEELEKKMVSLEKRVAELEKRLKEVEGLQDWQEEDKPKS
jgi:hypothetical protein